MYVDTAARRVNTAHRCIYVKKEIQKKKEKSK